MPDASMQRATATTQNAAIAGGPVIHVGYPKTGSSFLQEVIFPRVEGYEYIAERGRVRDLSKRYWFEYEDRFKAAFDLDSNYIISREHLSTPLLTMLNAPSYQYRPMALANLLHFYRDRGRFIVVIRRQDSLAESLMKFKPSYFHDERTLFLDFASQGSRIGQGRVGDMLLQSFDFCGHIAQIAGVVGRERVAVLLYEDLVHEPATYLRQLGTIFGQDLQCLLPETAKQVNASKSEAKLRNPFLGAIDRRLGGLVGRLLPAKSVALSERMRARLMAIYAPGNRTLFEWLGIENRYGYY